MGLDMYLNVRKYVSQHDRKSETESSEFKTLIYMSGLEGLTKYSQFGGVEISYPVGYWRKANAIHGWFINNCAEGEDNCEPVGVSRSDLQLLLTACKEVMAETDPDEKKDKADDVGLTPTEGFFFGGYQMDEYYDADLNGTIEMLEHLLGLIPEDSLGFDFVYQASW